jgi:tetratricopeptide (TPR) repeat protein
VWAPDVAATVAALTGVALAPAAEGINLMESPPEERILFSWSWAPRDQMGWLPLRAARSGAWKRLEGLQNVMLGLEGAEDPAGPEVEEALAAALAGRRDVAPDRVDIQPLRPWFEANDVTVEPLPAGGRAFGPAAVRRDAVALVWNARHEFLEERYALCPISWRGALESDPQSLAALLGLGQTLAMSGVPQAEEFLRKAVAWYPGDWDVLHWLGHALWRDSWRSSEELFSEILPHRPDDPDVLYDLACGRSLDGDLERAESYLRAALEAGFRDWRLIETDPDMRNLRETPRFAQLLREYGR